MADIALCPSTPRQKRFRQDGRDKAKKSAALTPVSVQKISQIYSRSVSGWLNILASLCATSIDSLPKGITSQASGVRHG